MSLGARIAIGSVALIAAAVFFITALDPGELPAGAFIFYSLAAFCVVIAIACFFPQTHPITLRLIGATIFGIYVVYVIDSFRTQNLGRAMVGFLVWGIPSGYLTIMGQYPNWGSGSKAFNAKQNRKAHR